MKTDFLGKLFLRQHARGLEQLHQRLWDQSSNSKGRIDKDRNQTLNLVPTTGVEAISADVACVLEKRFPSMNPSAIAATVQAVATTLENGGNISPSPVPSNSTEPNSPSPLSARLVVPQVCSQDV